MNKYKLFKSLGNISGMVACGLGILGVTYIIYISYYHLIFKSTMIPFRMILTQYVCILLQTIFYKLSLKNLKILGNLE